MFSIRNAARCAGLALAVAFAMPLAANADEPQQTPAARAMGAGDSLGRIIYEKKMRNSEATDSHKARLDELRYRRFTRWLSRRGELLARNN